MKIIRRIITFFILLVQVILISNKVNAANINETKILERGPLGYYCVEKWDGSKWIYLTYNTTYYTDSNGKKYVAYCLCPGMPGVGYVSGEKDSYNVKIQKMLDDERVWRIIKNGYPYKTVSELGVETVDDAYFATMQAVNCVLRGYTLDQAKELYSPGKFAINGESLEDIQRRGTKTLNAMFNLINIGLNGTETRAQLQSLSVESINDLVAENEIYYSQTFQVKSGSSINNYTITKLENLPNGTYSCDVNGNKKSQFGGNEKFKIMIPKKEITSDINGKISINASQRSYPIYYGESSISRFSRLCFM